MQIRAGVDTKTNHQMSNILLVLFVFLPLKGKQKKGKLSVLCVCGEPYSGKDPFRVNIKPPF